jgi:manganese/iron transport system substrate-binding protein
MRRNMLQLAAIAAVILLSGCNSPTAPSQKSTKLKVIATHSVLCDLTQQIAKANVDLKCLVQAGQDPHTYQATPEDRKAIESANLVLYGGYDFEPEIIRLVQAAPSAVVKVAVSELAVPQPLMGKPEPPAAAAADPHIWNNAQHGIAMVQVVEAELIKANPENTATYTANAKQLRDRLTTIDVWIKAAIATIPPRNRKLVTTHDALAYYGAAYGLTIEGALQGLSTEAQPTPMRVKQLVDLIKAAQVPTIFAEVSINPALIKTVAQDAKVKLAESELFADGLGASGSGAETYEQMLISNTTTIVVGLGGKVGELRIEN